MIHSLPIIQNQIFILYSLTSTHLFGKNTAEDTTLHRRRLVSTTGEYELTEEQTFSDSEEAEVGQRESREWRIVATTGRSNYITPGEL